VQNLKIVVFGRGNGESILVELENNTWMVIDCFNTPGTKEPAALTYLKNLGFNPLEVLIKIVITHFHSDHIQGMLNLIKQASPDADIYMPEALTTTEAFKYYSELDILHGYDDISGVGELCKIVRYLDSKKREAIRIKQDSTIFNGLTYQISALSPSHKDCNDARNSFISDITSIESRIPVSATKPSHNHFCIVLNILSKTTNTSILLGSDLEVSGDSAKGWSSAITSNMAPQKNSVQIIKIPHHGSENGYHKSTWNEYVIQDVIAILTTFNSSSLPRQELINKYKSHMKHLLVTTKPKKNITSGIPRAVLKIMKKKNQLGTIVSSTPSTQFGYIEAIHSSNPPSYELFLDASVL